MNTIGKIFIVIPVYNRKAFTEQCLASLSKQSYAEFEVIIVDDGSTDGTAEMIREKFPEVHVLTGDGNLWWTGGINLGIRYALGQQANYVFALNDDTIAPPSLVEKMVAQARQRPMALFGALEISYDDQQPMYAGQDERWALDKSRRLLEQIPPDQQTGIHPVQTFHGRGLWIPKEVFDKIGLFDQKTFPHYMADFDFTYNAYKAGFRVFCNFDAIIYSFPEACGDLEIKQSKSIKAFSKHLFDQRGGGNLTNFTRYTLKNCPRHLLPIRLFIGYSRRLVGFWLR